jgi:hypothetical protein
VHLLGGPRAGAGRTPAPGRKRERVPLESDAAYTCPACFETNYLAVDPSGGRRQQFGEDCPVCCRPILFTVEFDHEGEPVVTSAELDQ